LSIEIIIQQNGHQTSGVGHRMSDVGYQLSDVGYRLSDIGQSWPEGCI